MEAAINATCAHRQTVRGMGTVACFRSVSHHHSTLDTLSPAFCFLLLYCTPLPPTVSFLKFSSPGQPRTVARKRTKSSQYFCIITQQSQKIEDSSLSALLLEMVFFLVSAVSHSLHSAFCLNVWWETQEVVDIKINQMGIRRTDSYPSPGALSGIISNNSDSKKS